jgi:protein-S-isoprenylcysteine O-methyltransferase Ste14
MPTGSSRDADRERGRAGWPRQLAAVLALPVVVTVVVPWWLLHAAMRVPAVVRFGTASDAAARIAGAVLMLAGVTLLFRCIRLFHDVGRGTLAPWDPTRRLVVTGPYRHVRNPMITAVATTLLGEAFLMESPRLALWCATFVAVNHVYFIVSEEPGLLRRFGPHYERYRRAVPRWIPSRRPWIDEDAPR